MIPAKTIDQKLALLPMRDYSVFADAVGFRYTKKRMPFPHELSSNSKTLLGKKVFEYAAWRNEYFKNMHDEIVYHACLQDHKVSRYNVDNFDLEREFPVFNHFSGRNKALALKQHAHCTHFRDGMIQRLKGCFE